MSAARSYVETSTSIPISSTRNLTGRFIPKTTVCREQPTVVSSKIRYNLNRVHLNLIELQRLHQIYIFW